MKFTSLSKMLAIMLNLFLVNVGSGFHYLAWLDESTLSKHAWSNVVLDCRKLFFAQGSCACVKCPLIKRNHHVSLFPLPMQSINTEQIVLNAFS